jgi:hypothetical protein
MPNPAHVVAHFWRIRVSRADTIPGQYVRSFDRHYSWVTRSAREYPGLSMGTAHRHAKDGSGFRRHPPRQCQIRRRPAPEIHFFSIAAIQPVLSLRPFISPHGISRPGD